MPKKLSEEPIGRQLRTLIMELISREIGVPVEKISIDDPLRLSEIHLGQMLRSYDLAVDPFPRRLYPPVTVEEAIRRVRTLGYS